MIGQSGAGRNQSANNDVFFETTQLVALAHDRRLGQNTGRFLEGRCADEAVCGQGRLRDTEQQIGECCSGLALGAQGVIGIEHFGTFNLFAVDVIGVAGVFDHYPSQHLANNHFNVLVVDLHTLEAVNVLHLINNVTGQLFRAEQSQNILRIGGAVHDAFPLVDHLTFVNDDAFFLGHELFPDGAFRIGDLQTDLAFGFLAEGHGTRHFSQNALVFGRTRFEQLGHAW